MAGKDTDKIWREKRWNNRPRAHTDERRRRPTTTTTHDDVPSQRASIGKKTKAMVCNCCNLYLESEGNKHFRHLLQNLRLTVVG